MQKIIFLILGMFLFVQTSFAQEEPEIIIDHEYSNQIEQIFGQLERNRIPHGLLENAAFPFTNLQAYNGVRTDSTKISVEVFSEIYKTLLSARMTPQTGEDFTEMQEIADTWSSYRTAQNTDENDITLVLSGLYYKYATIPETSFLEEKINREGNVLLDRYVGGVWQNPYEEKETVAIAPPTSVLNTLSFSVMLPQDLFFSNAKEQGIVNIQADFADGNGFVPVNFNSKIPLSYNNEGMFEWVFRFERWDGQFIEVDVPILIDDPIVFPLPGQGKNNVVIANGNYDATLRIDYAPGSNKKVMRPLIVAEGFDPESILKPEKLGGSTTLKHFLSSIEQNSDLNNLINTNNQQYDIIYIDWKNGAGDIKQNAETLIKVIEWVNAEKLANGSTASNVVIGQSMGGLVSSYALRKMENTSGKDHETSLYIAHDTPFQGANTPVSTQFLFRHMAATYQSNPFAVFAGEILIPFIQDLSSMMGGSFLSQYTSPGTALGIQDAPAALQMTKYHVTPSNQVTTAHFDYWRSEFDAMGYPQETRNIAVSNGNMCAEPQEVSGGEQMFLLNGTYSTSNILKELLLHIGGTIWGSTSGNWQLTIISLIPGKTKIDYTVDLRAIPETNQSTRIVYRGGVKYHKILWDLFGWRPTVTTEVVPLRELGVASWAYPMETFSGGTNNLQSSVAGFVDLPAGSFLKPRYGFIPAASALDINRNNNPLSVNDYRIAYNDPNNLGDSSLSTPFENFVTERTVGTRDNFGHISFSLKNSDWFADELNADRNNTTNYPSPECIFTCGGLEIFGVDFICDSANYTFSIPEIDNVNITWSVNNLQIVSGQGTSNLVVKNSGGLSNKRVSVTISSFECGSITLHKDFFAGIPQPLGLGITGPTVIYKTNNQNYSNPLTYTAPTALGATHYEWVLPGNFEVVPNFGGLGIPDNWRLLESTADTREIIAQSNLITNGQVKVRACNECGCSAYITLDVTNQYIDIPGHVIAPNPADDMLNIILADGAPVPDFIGGRTNVRVYNLQSHLVHEFEIYNEGGSTNIAHLPVGFYKVQIDMQNDTFQVLNLLIER